MSDKRYYRGGNSLKPRVIDYNLDPDTGLVQPGRGVSVQDTPSGLDRFGGAHEVVSLPPTLEIVRAGRRAGHYEIAPVAPMTEADYEQALEQAVLVPIS